MPHLSLRTLFLTLSDLPCAQVPSATAEFHKEVLRELDLVRSQFAQARDNLAASEAHCASLERDVAEVMLQKSLARSEALRSNDQLKLCRAELEELRKLLSETELDLEGKKQELTSTQHKKQVCCRWLGRTCSGALSSPLVVVVLEGLGLFRCCPMATPQESGWRLGDPRKRMILEALTLT